MTPDTPTLEKKLRLTAIYMGAKQTDAGQWTFDEQPTSYYRPDATHIKFNYDSDWNWLQKVWKKVFFDLHWKTDRDKHLKEIQQVQKSYHFAVDDDSVADAFQVCYEAIQLLKELKANNK